MKALTPLNKICEGIPEEFVELLKFCRSCRENEKLDY